MTLEKLSEQVLTYCTGISVLIGFLCLVVLCFMIYIYYLLEKSIDKSKTELRDYVDKINYDHEEVKKLNQENSRLKNELFFYKELDNKNTIKLVGLEQKYKELKKFGKVVEKNGK